MNHRSLLLAGLLLLAWTPLVRAHALGAQPRIQGDKVLIEAYYDDNTPAIKALVKVFGGDSTAIVEGKTDDKGLFVFARPVPGKYRVVVDAGAGHRTQFDMNIPAASPRTQPLVPASEQGDMPTPPDIHEGPSREEFTGYPLLKVGLGLGSIAAFALAFWVARRNRGEQTP